MELEPKQLMLAVKAIAEEKNLPEDTVKDIVEQALGAAYRKDYGEREQEIRVELDMVSGKMDAFVEKTVVDEVEDEMIEISLADAKKIKKDAVEGDLVEIMYPVESFGRVAAQTAKQVVLQRLREAERELMLNEYEGKIGTIINGIVARIDGRLVRVELGKAQAIMPMGEQIQGERYYPGQRLKFYLKEVERGTRGPQLIVSRGCPQFLEFLFRAEVPEMESGAVIIKAIAREAGVRSKLAVHSLVQGVDPVGTFVGGHGTRVNAVMGEIGDQEKIDIVVWADETSAFISNALSPTQVTKVTLDEPNRKAIVMVPSDQLSIAIGKSGQNVRLASKLSGYDIDIVAAQTNQAEQAPPPVIETKAEEVVSSAPKQKLKKKSELENSLLEAIEEHGE